MKVLVIGLDGATWDVILPLVKEGKLPTFKKLLKEGAWGTLRSTVPPLTGPAWLAMATGKTPGKTGVIDFVKRVGEHELKPISSSDFREHGAIWDFLSQKGIRVGIFSYPMLFPPYPVNGFMTSGLGSSANSDFTYPRELKKEILSVAQNYCIFPDLPLSEKANPPVFMEKMRAYFEDVKKVMLHLLSREWDFLFLVISAPDLIQHRMWVYFDETHPNYKPELAKRYRPLFVDFWKEIDATIAQILNAIPEDTLVFFVSDHGFGKVFAAFNVASWLVKKGYLIKREQSLLNKIRMRTFSLLKKIRQIFLDCFPNALIVPFGFQGKVRKELCPSLLSRIDLDRSPVLLFPHTTGEFAAIYLNEKVVPEEKRAEVLAQLIKELKSVPKELKRKTHIDIFLPKQLYHGPKSFLLPDIIFLLEGYCYSYDDFHDDIEEKDKPPVFWNGSHRLNGIFLAYGPSIKKGAKINAEIYDIAPTILHIFGLPIPKDMDGKVLMRIFEPNSKFAKRKPRYVDPNLL